jgi:hypothetical protein
MTPDHDNIYSILSHMYRTKHITKNQAMPRRSLFTLPPSLLRLIIQRAQQSQTATIDPINPVTTIPLSNETLGE